MLGDERTLLRELERLHAHVRPPAPAYALVAMRLVGPHVDDATVNRAGRALVVSGSLPLDATVHRTGAAELVVVVPCVVPDRPSQVARCARLVLGDLDDPGIDAAMTLIEHRASWTETGERSREGVDLWRALRERVETERRRGLKHRVERLEQTLTNAGGASLETVAELEERVRIAERLAHSDPATGLLNRRGLDAARPSRRGPLVVAFVDIDDLRMFNSIGWDHGDRAIGIVVGALSVACDGDLIGRWGGDELVVVSCRRLDDVTASLTEALDACRHVDVVGRAPTFSAGVVQVEDPAAYAAGLREAQDLAHRAKTTKGRIEVAKRRAID